MTALLTPMLDVPLAGRGAWTRDTLAESDWLMPIPDACLAELEQALAPLDADATPSYALDIADFNLPASAALMAAVRSRLEAGPLFAVLDRLPTAAWSRERQTRAYWLLSSLLSHPVQQTYKGTMLFDVHDTGVGRQMTPGSGIRATITNLDLNFHNDNCFNTLMPDFVGLLCLRAARSGGVSRAISFHTVHNVLRTQAPALLVRLYQPVWWDRHREFGEGDSPVVSNPVFEAGVKAPLARFSIYNIRGGYRILGIEPDADLDAALDLVVSTLKQAELQCEFTMQPGQIQFVNNRAIGHARTEFIDHEAPDARRHLVRLWLRDKGSVAYEGA